MSSETAKRSSEADIRRIMAAREWVREIIWMPTFERIAGALRENLRRIIGDCIGPGGDQVAK